MSDRRPPVPRCPTCGAPRSPAFRPFCSRRCRNIDLNRWLTGAYAVPAVEDEDDEEAG
jgi:uncharacterized protein